jgi:hypothetical protein
MRVTKHIPRGVLLRLITRLRQWWLRRKVRYAVAACRKRMRGYTPAQRAELNERALAMIFPAGRRACANGHISAWAAKGSPCLLCASQEGSLSD